MSRSFIIIGEEPERPPLEELEGLVGKLDNYRQSVDRWVEQEKLLSDHKIYNRTDDDSFQEAKLLKQTRKCYYVQSACGCEHVLPSRLFDDLGRYTRRTGITVQYWQGWRARQELLDMIANARSHYARLKNDLVPQTVREVRKSGVSIPMHLVQRLKPHYAPKADKMRSG